jgi:16S rRNA (guanine527-N7)-methyltransferase
MFHVKQIEMLETALRHLDIKNVRRVIRKFEIYEELLLQWNREINLVSKRDEERIVQRHFLESIGFILSIHFPEHARVVDLGTGAGFPGIPVKIVRPDLDVYLVESINKKARFLETIVEALSLKGVEIICDRAENLENKIEPVDIVVGRSVASLDLLVKWSSGLLKQKTGILATVKGERLKEELKRFKKMEKQYLSKKHEIRKFNPFPSICPLDRSYMVVIKNSV